MADNATFTLLFYLIGAVGLDLFLRWVAFERIESIAIDIAIFSVVYSWIESLKSETGHPPWKIPVLLGLLCLGGLAILHHWLTKDLQETIEETYATLQKKMTDSNKKDVISANIPVAKYGIPVLLSSSVSWIRKGKRRRIRNIIKALRSADLDPTGLLNDESFLLPEKQRRLMIVAFFVLGAISVIIPLVYTIVYVNDSGIVK